MARYTGPRTRVSRRFGVPIFGASKYLERRNYPPGVHGPKSRRKFSDYAVGLMEKQKLRYFYGLQERQFRNVYEKALRMRGVTGEKMLQLLECRLDSIVFHAGFGITRPQARQLISHGHVRVNGRKVSVPSFLVKVNDVVEVKDHNVSKQLANKSLEGSTSRVVPDWVSLDRDHLKAKLLRIPTRDEINPVANEQAIVEFYSR
jgi:small subunit ribosomal protein S4